MISSADILKASILIVDDQNANVLLLEQMLREAGYVSIVSTKDPHEVCELHRKNRYALILLDLEMPGLDGFQVMEGLKAIETDGYLPVLAITVQPLHKLRALKAGAKDFVSKPFDLAEVLVRVHNLLEVRLLHLEAKRLYDQIVAEQKVSERMLLVFRSGPLAMSINTIADGRIIDANEEHCRFFGYSREEMVGRSVMDLNLWANSEDREPVMQRLLKEGSMRGFETKRRRKSGELRDVLASLELIKLPGQSEPVLISMFTDITERKQAEEQLKETHKQLLVFSRQAGMAEIATNVLHNVGNVLNSVNVASTCVADSLRKSKACNLSKVVALLGEHSGDLGAFLTSDPKGKHLPDYLAQLAEHLIDEQAAALKELAQLQKNIEHIKEIVTMQQGYAKVSGLNEMIKITDLVEDGLRLNTDALHRHGIEVVREFEEVPMMNVAKHNVLQIMVNLLRNATEACKESGRADKRLTVRVAHMDGRVQVSVVDNGVGIPPENLAHIFQHGFTTRKDGHGFGLHSCALAANEMGGSLTPYSDGCGQGATFTLELPVDTTTTPLMESQVSACGKA
jgi:PAS domain S-box-containing protein